MSDINSHSITDFSLECGQYLLEQSKSPEVTIPPHIREYFCRTLDIPKIIDLYFGGQKKAFAERFEIPLATVYNWCNVNGKHSRTCPDYVKKMICEILGLIDRTSADNNEHLSDR